jgi:hypothetical protein
MGRRGLQWLLGRFALRLFSLSAKLLVLLFPDWKARRWSNLELRKWAPLLSGDIINVSGWEDSDKEGGRYADYFTSASSYTISNVGGARGSAGTSPEVTIDLTKALPHGQVRKYSVVFNHTTLEHIFDIRGALASLCSLSRDVVIAVVPFMQEVHWEEGSYADYWRPTPFAMREMFLENGFELVHLAYNDNPVVPLYLFCVATCMPEKWENVFPAFSLSRAGAYPGRSWSRRRLPHDTGSRGSRTSSRAEPGESRADQRT